jgi:hypothetical protein
MLILEREARLAKLAGFTIREDGRYVRPNGVVCPHGRPPHFLSDMNAAFEYVLPILTPARRQGQALAAWGYAMAECARLLERPVSFVSAATLLCDAVEELYRHQLMQQGLAQTEAQDREGVSK